MYRRVVELLCCGCCASMRWSRPPFCPSRFAAPCARHPAENVIESSRLPSALQQFAKDRTQWNLLAVSTEILERAEQIVASHTVRTLDAIHIASAQEFAERLQARVPFISADHRQIAAAAAAGLIVQQVGP
jgi:predicted nucleic acid-binding protein